MHKYVLGFDEVGRGPLAGPVVVACVLTQINIKIPSEIVIRDSKKMTKLQKNKSDIWIRSNFEYGIGEVSAEKIDEIGISISIKKAAQNALNNLLDKNKKLLIDKIDFLVDGREKWFPNCQTIIKGDSKIPQISMASIIAKVYRDNLMISLSEKYPQFAFQNHVGYGTKNHINAIKNNGLIKKIHRYSFCKNLLK